MLVLLFTTTFHALAYLMHPYIEGILILQLFPVYDVCM